MGGQARARSAAARATWERADAHTRAHLGFSLLDVVQRNPTELRLASGEVRRHPAGVLHRTELTQPALLTLAAAQVAELRDRRGAGGGRRAGRRPQRRRVRRARRARCARARSRCGARVPPRRAHAGVRRARRRRAVAVRDGRGRPVARRDRAAAGRRARQRQRARPPGRASSGRGARSTSSRARGRAERCAYSTGSTCRFTRRCSRPRSTGCARSSSASSVAVDHRLLAGRWVPNLVGRAFSLERDFVAAVGVAPPAPGDPDVLARLLVVELLARQVAAPVRWVDTQRALVTPAVGGGLGARRIVEVGPAGAAVLTGLMRTTLESLDLAGPAPELLHAEDDRDALLLLHVPAPGRQRPGARRRAPTRARGAHAGAAGAPPARRSRARGAGRGRRPDPPVDRARRRRRARPRARRRRRAAARARRAGARAPGPARRRGIARRPLRRRVLAAQPGPRRPRPRARAVGQRGDDASAAGRDRRGRARAGGALPLPRHLPARHDRGGPGARARPQRPGARRRGRAPRHRRGGSGPASPTTCWRCSRSRRATARRPAAARSGGSPAIRRRRSRGGRGARRPRGGAGRRGARPRARARGTRGRAPRSRRGGGPGPRRAGAERCRPRAARRSRRERRGRPARAGGRGRGARTCNERGRRRRRAARDPRRGARARARRRRSHRASTTAATCASRRAGRARAGTSSPPTTPACAASSTATSCAASPRTPATPSSPPPRAISPSAPPATGRRRPRRRAAPTSRTGSARPQPAARRRCGRSSRPTPAAGSQRATRGTARRSARWTSSQTLADGGAPDLADALRDALSTRPDLRSETALVTGASPGSIAAELVRRLLGGGATVVVATSTDTPARRRWYRELYRTSAGPGAELHVLPANLAAFADVDALAAWLAAPETADRARRRPAPRPAAPDDRRAVRGDARRPAISATPAPAPSTRCGCSCSACSGSSPRSPRACPTAPPRRRSCSPLSPNHGGFGGDGAYGETKAALEVLLARWRSEHATWGRACASSRRASAGSAARGSWAPPTPSPRSSRSASACVRSRPRRPAGCSTSSRRRARWRERPRHAPARARPHRRPVGDRRPARRRRAARRRAARARGGARAGARSSTPRSAPRRRRAPPASRRCRAARTDTATRRAAPHFVHSALAGVDRARRARARPRPRRPRRDRRLRRARPVRHGGGALRPRGRRRTVARRGRRARLALRTRRLRAHGLPRALGRRRHARRGPRVRARGALRRTRSRPASASARSRTAGLVEAAGSPAFAPVELPAELRFEVDDEEQARSFEAAGATVRDATRRGHVARRAARRHADPRAAHGRPRRAASPGQLPAGLDLARFGIPRRPAREPPTRWRSSTSPARRRRSRRPASRPRSCSARSTPRSSRARRAAAWAGSRRCAACCSTRCWTPSARPTACRSRSATSSPRTPCSPTSAPTGRWCTPSPPARRRRCRSRRRTTRSAPARRWRCSRAASTTSRPTACSASATWARPSSSDELEALGIAPHEASRPNDVRRRGFVEAQGGGALLVVRGDVALALGLPVRGVLAYASSHADGVQSSIPSPGMGVLAAALGGRASPLARALHRLGLTADDIAVVSKHDTSTQMNDPNEADLHERIQAALGRTPGNPLLVVSQKSVTGHAKGGAAAWQVEGVLQMMERGIVPGNRNLECADPLLRDGAFLTLGDRPIRLAEQEPIRAALVTSLGFGHVSALLAIAHPDCFLAAVPEAEREDYLRRAGRRRAEGVHERLRTRHGRPAAVRRTDRRLDAPPGDPVAERDAEAALLTDPAHAPARRRELRVTTLAVGLDIVTTTTFAEQLADRGVGLRRRDVHGGRAARRARRRGDPRAAPRRPLRRQGGVPQGMVGRPRRPRAGARRGRPARDRGRRRRPRPPRAAPARRGRGGARRARGRARHASCAACLAEPRPADGRGGRRAQRAVAGSRLAGRRHHRSATLSKRARASRPRPSAWFTLRPRLRARGRAARRPAAQGHGGPVHLAPDGRRVAGARRRRRRGRGHCGAAARRGRGPGRPGHARAAFVSCSEAAWPTIVAACSDTDVTPKPPWRERKEAYIAHLRDPALPAGTLRVSLADKLHNSRAILFDLRAGHDVFARFNAGRDRPALVLRRARPRRSRDVSDSPMAAELRHVVDELLAHD